MTRRHDTRRRIGGGFGSIVLLLSIFWSSAPSIAAECEPNSSFLPNAATLESWTQQIDSLGLRATGSPAHSAYLDLLQQRMTDVGLQNVRREAFTVDRWTATQAELALVGSGGPVPVEIASYIPYSGQTPVGGVTAPMVYLGRSVPPVWPAGSLSGKIVVADIVTPPLTAAIFYASSYYLHDPDGTLTPAYPYERSWIAQLVVGQIQSAAIRAGAAGLVAILDVPGDFADGSYFPYNGKVAGLPGVYVNRETGAALRDAIQAGPVTGRLVLQAEQQPVTSWNLLGSLPGTSDETILLNSHTDGGSAIWDNGPPGVLALAQYFAAQPAACRPRSMEVVFTAGHLYGKKGMREFIQRHDDDLLAKTVTAVTLEHLGAQEWLEDPDAVYRPTGDPEIAAVFTSESAALVQLGIDLVKRENLERAFVSHAWYPTEPDGTVPRAVSIPGEANKLMEAGVPVIQYITGPTYLLNAFTTMPMIDFDLMHRTVRGFATMIEELHTIPGGDLRGATARRTLHELGLQ